MCLESSSQLQGSRLSRRLLPGGNTGPGPSFHPPAKKPFSSFPSEVGLAGQEFWLLQQLLVKPRLGLPQRQATMRLLAFLGHLHYSG